YEAREEEIEGRLNLIFSILKNGDLAELQVLQSSGSQVLDDGAINAVRFAAPYYPIPQSMGISKLNVIAAFEYRINHYLVK
ncbi:MAG: TonB family protein, partial [Pseudomonadota bacterium]